MALLEKDWIEESKAYYMNIENLQTINRPMNILILEKQQPKFWGTRKVYRPSEYFKNHKWIYIDPKNQVIKIKSEKNTKEIFEWKTSDELNKLLEKYFSMGNVIDSYSFSELPNIRPDI
jgi:tRNA A37 N6-isopentenylltransferase MiaA